MKIPALKGFDPLAFDKYVKNTGWLMFGKVLSMLVGFVLIRYLGPISFGDLSFADALTAIVAAVGTLGLDTFIIREIIHEPENRNEILGTAFWMRAVVNLALIPVSVLIYISYHSRAATPGTPLTLIIVLLSLASFFKSFNVIDSYFQSQVQSKFVVQVQNVCLVLSAIIKLSLIWFELPLVYFAAALVLDAVMLATGLVIIYRKRNMHLSQWVFNLDRAKSMLKKAAPLILSAVMISIYMKIDQVMLKTVGSRQVGIYSAAARISEAWYFIPVAIVTSVFPAIINARKNDIAHYHKRLQNLYDLLVAISLPVAVIISFSAESITHLLYGNRFEGAGLMLSIHIWSGIFVFLGSASSQYLLAEGYTMISFIRTTIGALVNVLLNLWLIPKYGGVGASIATLVAYFIATFSILLIPQTYKQGLLMLRSLFLISLLQKTRNK